jgi:hypothetical protein
MEKEKREITDYTMGIGKANLIALFLMVPILIILLSPFILIWSYETFEISRKAFISYFVPLILIGIFVHELLHGISWAFYASKGMKSIKFGFKWKFLTPYCHCKEPLKIKHYRIGAAMPLLILGILPSIIAIVIGNGALLTFGIIFSWAAGGDIIALFMLRKLDKDTYVSDHPHKMGFYINDEKQNATDNQKTASNFD